MTSDAEVLMIGPSQKRQIPNNNNNNANVYNENKVLWS